MIQIKIIPKELTYSIRQKVLRKGQSIETCYFENDDLSSTYHFGIFLDEKIIGVVSLFDNVNNVFAEQKQFQVRGMAILEEYQNRGYGGGLLKKIEEFSKLKQKEILWFNAREKAINFYKKVGYKIKGNIFDIPNVGKHFFMFKKLL